MMDANEEKQIQFEERLAFIIDGVLFSVFLEHLKQEETGQKLTDALISFYCY